MPEARKVARFPRNESILTGKLYVPGRKEGKEGGEVGRGMLKVVGIWIERGCSQAITQLPQLLFTCWSNYAGERRHE